MMALTTAPREPRQQLTMVLVTDQFECRRLIEEGRALASRDETLLEVINVAVAGVERNHEALEYLYRVSRENGASMMIHYSENPSRFITRIIRDELPRNVVTGLPRSKGSLLHKIWTRFEMIHFYTVDMDGEARPVTLKDRVIA